MPALQQGAGETPALQQGAGGTPALQIPRQGDPVFDADGAEIGTVTSGAYSPTLDKVIAMAYVATGSAVVGAPVAVGQGGQRRPAVISRLPFVPAR